MPYEDLYARLSELLEQSPVGLVADIDKELGDISISLYPAGAKMRASELSCIYLYEDGTWEE